MTTWLSGGRPWLDCVASWVLLIVGAALLMRTARAGWSESPPGTGWWCALLFLALYPGHLLNLQWGWQVAVFISLLGAVVPIYVLTRPEPNLAWYLLALVSAGIGVLGFTTTLAIFPVAVVLIAARNDLSVSKRLAWIVAWAVGVVTLCFCLIVARGEGVPWAGASESAIYVLNYVGAGVAHFAGRLAPFLTVLALLTSVHAAIRLRGSPQSRPWLSLMAFVLGCALLTAFGRAGYFGANQAFVVRYISFASLFWLGWVGLMVLAWRDAPPIWPWVMRPLLCGVLLLALVNAAHATRLAAAVHERARGYAERIRAHYPQVDGETMQAAYEFRADVARERLRLLRERDFAPFDPPVKEAP